MGESGDGAPPGRYAAPYWAFVFFFVPFVLMLGVHRMLGLSDALMVSAGPGERPAYGYNLVMVGAFYLGVAAAGDHLLTPSRRSTPWMSIKLALFAILMAAGACTLF